MDKTLAWRAAGLAAVAGGLMRAAAPLAGRLGPHEAHIAYLIIDVLLTFGLLGVYGRFADALGRVGLLAFAAAIVGILLVRSQGEVPGAYMAGAVVWSLAMATLGVRLLLVPRGPRIAPALWIAAVPAGLAGAHGLIAAGTLFALGYIAAGIGLIRQAA